MEMDDDEVEVFLLSDRNRPRNQIHRALQNPVQLWSPVNLTPQFAMLLHQGQRIAALSAFGVAPHGSRCEQQAKYYPRTLEQRKPIVL